MTRFQAEISIRVDFLSVDEMTPKFFGALRAPTIFAFLEGNTFFKRKRFFRVPKTFRLISYTLLKIHAYWDLSLKPSHPRLFPSTAITCNYHLSSKQCCAMSCADSYSSRQVDVCFDSESAFATCPNTLSALEDPFATWSKGKFRKSWKII